MNDQPKKSIFRHWPQRGPLRGWFWILLVIGILIIFLICFFRNVGDIWTKYNQHFDLKPCNFEGVTSTYRFDRRGDDLYFLPKPISGKLTDLQETGYVWDESSTFNVKDRSQPVCHRGIGNEDEQDTNDFYCYSVGYYAKIPPNDKEYIKGSREAHNYVVNLVLVPQNTGNDTEYKVDSCYYYEKQPQM